MCLSIILAGLPTIKPHSMDIHTILCNLSTLCLLILIQCRKINYFLRISISCKGIAVPIQQVARVFMPHFVEIFLQCCTNQVNCTVIHVMYQLTALYGCAYQIIQGSVSERGRVVLFCRCLRQQSDFVLLRRREKKPSPRLYSLLLSRRGAFIKSGVYALPSSALVVKAIYMYIGPRVNPFD